MIRLDATTRKLQIALDSSSSAGACVAVVSFFDENIKGEQTKGASQLTSVSGVADTDICAAPKQNYVRNIDTLTVFNGDNATHTIVVKIDDGGTDSPLMKQSLLTLKTLCYDHQSGWQVL